MDRTQMTGKVLHITKTLRWVLYIYIYIFLKNRGFFLHVSCPDSIAHYNDIDVDGFVVVVVVGSFCMYLDHIALHITKTLRCTLKKKVSFSICLDQIALHITKMRVFLCFIEGVGEVFFVCVSLTK